MKTSLFSIVSSKNIEQARDIQFRLATAQRRATERGR